MYTIMSAIGSIHGGMVLFLGATLILVYLLGLCHGRSFWKGNTYLQPSEPYNPIPPSLRQGKEDEAIQTTVRSVSRPTDEEQQRRRQMKKEREAEIRSYLRLPREEWPREEPHKCVAELLDILEVLETTMTSAAIVDKRRKEVVDEAVRYIHETLKMDRVAMEEDCVVMFKDVLNILQSDLVETKS